MKLIDNYLNSLESYLTDDLKQEVRAELESSIYDAIEDKQTELGRDLNQQEQEELLLELGHPMLVASKYLPNQQLIGEEYFPAYKKALHLALVISLTVNFIIGLPYILSGGNIFANIFQTAWHLFFVALFVFAIVTIVFYLLQSNQVSITKLYAWSPKDLVNSNPKLSIKRVDIAFELLFEVIFLAWWNNLIYFPATLIEKKVLINFSLSPEWSSVFWSINVIILLGIGINLFKMAIAGWNKSTLIGNIALNLISLAIIFQISQFNQYLIYQPTIEVETNVGWDKLLQLSEFNVPILLASIAFFILWDIYSNFQKLMRLNK